MGIVENSSFSMRSQAGAWERGEKKRNSFFIKFDNIYIYIFFFAILAFGNFARFIHLGSFSNNVLISEVILYILSLCWILLNTRRFIYVYKMYAYISVIAIFSFMIGFIQFGFEQVAFFYTIRLVMFFIVAASLAFAVYKRFKNRYDIFFKRMLSFYTVGLIFGYLIYIFFPESTELWLFLSMYGINFSGDPHANRFVSIYFDPNFYSIIAIIPLLLSLLLYKKTSHFIYLLAVLFFSISVFLAGSRSGTASLVMLLIYLLIPKIFLIFKTLKIEKKIILSVMIIFVFLLMLYPLYSQNIDTLMERIANTKNDDSANARYLSFLFAIEIIKKYLFFGMGYNYLASYMLSKGMLSSVDSSILTIVCNFGLLLSIIIFSMVLIFLINLYKKMKLLNDINLLLFIKILYFYLFITIFFTSNFNNILFYFFWLLPVLLILFYLSLLGKNAQRII